MTIIPKPTGEEIDKWLNKNDVDKYVSCLLCRGDGEVCEHCNHPEYDCTCEDGFYELCPDCNGDGCVKNIDAYYEQRRRELKLLARLEIDDYPPVT